ncbi:hypothetical protein FV233_27210 [Methylobacterium sp. WL7]|nr:hypothetical protein FV233_27210 [Methylobacterium sp. WL7]
MARGGARPGAGRKPGIAAQKTKEARERMASEGITPLDYMAGLLNGTVEYDEIKFEAAKAAAPYVHPRLSAVEAKVAMTVEDLDEAQLNAEILREGTAAGLISGGSTH